MGDLSGRRVIPLPQGRGHPFGGIGLGVGEAGEKPVVEPHVARRAPQSAIQVQAARGGSGFRSSTRPGTGQGDVRGPHRALSPVGQGGVEPGRFDRFGEVFLHTECQAPIPLLHQGVGRHRQHRQVVEAGVAAQTPGGLPAIQHRHVEVHEHQVEGEGSVVPSSHLLRPLQQPQGLRAVLGHGDPHGHAVEQFNADLLVHLVVLHQQHPQAGQPLAQPGLRHQRVGPVRGGGGLHQFGQGVQ